MKRSILELLRCPSCRLAYEAVAHEEEAGRLVTGALRCAGCGIVVPVVQGFPLFTEPMLHLGEATPVALRALGGRCFGTATDYDAYRRLKRQRGGLEIYAAFQPFNESTRAFQPAMAAFAAALKPGDAILDPWCRSGWSAEWLAAAFPEQTIVALWEGERSVLGYRGFAYWFERRRRTPNIEVMFAHPERGLPFADGAFGAVYALDVFHRFSPVPFAGELLRVAAPRAAIALAHVHLSNSEPDPYFDRGGRHWHGADYQAWFQRLAETGGREGRVFSEADLFDANGGPLPAADPQTAHYNGFALLTPKGAAPAAAAPEFRWADQRLLVNPLFAIHLARRLARIEGAQHDGAVRELLDRHPIYEQRLPKDPVRLSDDDFVLLALAIAGCTLGEAAAHLALDRAAFDARLARLEDDELLCRTPVSWSGVTLQRFHANQIAAAEAGGWLAALLGALAENPQTVLSTSDGGAVTGAELHAAVAALAGFLDSRGLTPGRRLRIADTEHPLAVALLLAGLARGLEVALCQGAGDSAADLVAGPSGVPFEAEEGVQSLAGALAEPYGGGLDVQAGGRLALAVGGRPATLDAETLADAALALSGAVLPREPLAGVAAFPDLLACLVAFGGGQSVMLRT